MIKTPEYQKSESSDTREFRASVCGLCFWIVILAFCWVIFTMEHVVDDFGSAVAALVMLSFAVVFFIISIYKIVKANVSLYKHR